MAPHAEQRFRWSWDFAAPPEALWPLVSNTDRFNRDCGYPSVTVLPPGETTGTNGAAPGTVTNTRRLRAKVMGIVIEWEELAFEWVAPTRFAVERTYFSGPITKMIMSCELTPRPGGGTTLVYAMRLTPSSLLGRLALPFSIGKKARETTERVFRRYDEFALSGLRNSQLAQRPTLAAGGAERLGAISRALVDDAGQPAPLVEKLRHFIAHSDDLAAARIRPYALADEWRMDRRDTLHLFLHATRGGLLDFSWDLVCPHCRGTKASQSSLSAVKPHGHCDSCHVDFTANFDQSVELTFTPNAAVRTVVRTDYCVGGPQVTPHIVAQQWLGPADHCTLRLALAVGRYHARARGLAEQNAFRIDSHGPATMRIDLGAKSPDEPAVAPGGELILANATDQAQFTIIERLAWSDQSTTAAEVTSLQLFRDLFSREVLRPSEQISVGSMTIVFTDLKNSTQLYQEIGDAPAFGRVLTHFEILKAAVAAENGCIVKTMGDSIMAVFPRAISAVRSMLSAQRWLANPQTFVFPKGVTVPPSSLQSLALKAGIHAGPCLAINQNDRLDYFGSTVNITARLCGLSSGTDIVLSNTVRADPEVTALLGAKETGAGVKPEKALLRGYGEVAFDVWRLQRGQAH